MFFQMPISFGGAFLYKRKGPRFLPLSYGGNFIFYEPFVLNGNGG